MRTITAYSVGMIITFVALFGMQTAQPALIYLVPCTLVPFFMLAIARGELRKLWFGHLVS